MGALLTVGETAVWGTHPSPAWSAWQRKAGAESYLDQKPTEGEVGPGEVLLTCQLAHLYGCARDSCSWWRW